MHARELNSELELSYPHPVCCIVEGEEIPNRHIKKTLKQAQVNMLSKVVKDQKWESKLLANRRKDDDLNKACFSWVHEWKTTPTHTITGLQELHQQLLSAKLYLTKKAKTLNTHDYNCQMCGKEPESVAHVIAG